MDYVIADELHEDGGKHFHVVLISKRKLDVRSLRKFDVEFEGKTYECHCTAVKNLSAVVAYVCKSGSYLSSLKNLYNGVFLPLEELMRDIADKEEVDAALKYLDENEPKKAMGSKSLLSVERYLRLRQDLKRRSQRAISEAISTPFKVEHFKSLPGIEAWKENGFQPTLIMVGPPGTSTTQFAKSLASKHGWKMHITNHREGLKDLTPEHDALFLDNCSLQDLTDQSILALLETSDNKVVRILHGSINKQKNMIQLFSFNKDVFIEIEPLFKKKEYLRRCRIVIIPSDFVINVNGVNKINITIHNHIYNNWSYRL